MQNFMLSYSMYILLAHSASVDYETGQGVRQARGHKICGAVTVLKSEMKWVDANTAPGELGFHG
jgi:hypothetical protein